MAVNSELKNILEEYNQRRAKENARVNDLLKRLIKESPKFKEAREEYSKARSAQAINKLKGKNTDIEKAKAKYQSELKSACKKCGIDIKDMEIRYTCADCKDTGFVGGNQKTYCHCLLNRATKSMLISQNLHEDATFDKFDESIFPNDEKIDKAGRTQREHILYVKERAEKWCDAFPDTNKLQTLFIGNTGVGKSFMVNCIAHGVIKKGYSVVNTAASGINEATLKIINEKDNSLMGLFKSCDLLIIDDLGMEPILRNITVETLYEVIEYRLLHKKHTTVVTNLALKKIEERYGYRIASRITSTKNTAVTQMLGDDLRAL